MSSVLSIAASGMAAAQKRLDVSARNVANASTGLPEGAPPEVAAAFAALRIDQAGTPGAAKAPALTALDLDLAGEAVQQMVARYTFAASARVAKVAAEMQKALLDVKA